MTWDEVERFFDRTFELAEELGLESAHEKVVFGAWQYGGLQAHNYFDRRNRARSKRHAEEWIRDGITGVCNCNLHLDPTLKALFERWTLVAFRLRLSHLIASSLGAGS